MATLVIIEHDNCKIIPSTKNVITAAKKLGAEIWAVVIGYKCGDVLKETKSLNSIKKIFFVDNEIHKNLFSEHYADQINNLIGLKSEINSVLMSTSSLGKETIPRVAAMQDVSQVSDVTNIISINEFERPIYAGNLISRISSSEPIKLLTIRPTKFKQELDNSGDVSHELIEAIKKNYGKELISKSYSQSDQPELSSAKIVVAGGRGLGSADNYRNILGPLAKKLNAALGASRAAVDAGYAPNDFQVGQTGKIVAPEIYFAIGLSGSVQHLAGMKDSKIIIGVNKDPNAPIFEISSFGLVADLFEAIPELTSKL